LTIITGIIQEPPWLLATKVKTVFGAIFSYAHGMFSYTEVPVWTPLNICYVHTSMQQKPITRTPTGRVMGSAFKTIQA